MGPLFWASSVILHFHCSFNTHCLFWVNFTVLLIQCSLRTRMPGMCISLIPCSWSPYREPQGESHLCSYLFSRRHKPYQTLPCVQMALFWAEQACLPSLPSPSFSFLPSFTPIFFSFLASMVVPSPYLLLNLLTLLKIYVDAKVILGMANCELDSQWPKLSSP